MPSDMPSRIAESLKRKRPPNWRPLEGSALRLTRAGASARSLVGHRFCTRGNAAI